MIGRFSRHDDAGRQAGAALAAALILAGAAATLASAAMLDATVQAAMTRQFANRSAARLTAYSALQMARLELPLRRGAATSYQYQFDSIRPMTATVSVRLLGETVSAAADSATTPPRYQHYELIAEVVGTAAPEHRRVLFVRMPIRAVQ